ncbi:MAG: sulfatase-like hydrolase/transferase [Chthoniobacteraceae bacterium]
MKAKLLLALHVLIFAQLAGLHGEDRKPNVVLILIDDFGYECVTANGGESYKTPVMDRLAATGVRFEQCHVQPLCTPTRVQLMTGMSNRRNYTHFGHMDPSQVTFGNVLKKAGYATCVTGKWQLSNGFEGPAHFGFDEYALWQLTRRPGRYKNPGLEINGKLHDYTKNEYGPDIVSDYALDFITRKKDAPFFLYYPMMLTHSPYDATPDSTDYLESKSGKGKGKGVAGHFPDMVAYTDKLIGKLVAKLDELKLRENTVLLILGDNGTGRGTPSRFKGRDVVGGKGTTTEWGTHVPLIGNWPGHFASGKVSPDLIDATDFLPTICEALSVKVPADLKIDGHSFLPQLRGEKGSPREWLYSWYNPSGGPKAQAEFAHDASFKLYTDGRFFAVQKDDLEKSPLADGALDADAKAAKAKLQAALKQFDGPRPEAFVKQGQKFGGETGEDANGNKVAKAVAKNGSDSPALPAKNADPRAVRFDERDLNHDGKLSPEEFMATASDKSNAKERFEKFDLDKNGFLSREEFLKQGKK